MKRSTGDKTSMIAKAFTDNGAKLDPKFRRAIIDLMRTQTNFLALRDFQSNRHMEADLSFRLSTIKSVIELGRRDNGYFTNRAEDEFLERHLFVALLEKAIIINASLDRSDIRDTSSFGFHLWHLKEQLIRQKISKPIEVIAAVLNKTRAMDDLGPGWSIGTIRNKISKVQRLIEESRGEGACHTPVRIGDWPRTASLTFIAGLSGGCAKCMEAWRVTLKVEPQAISTFDMALKEISKDLPSAVRRASLLKSKLDEMPLENLLNHIPERLRGGFLYLS